MNEIREWMGCCMQLVLHNILAMYAILRLSLHNQNIQGYRSHMPQHPEDHAHNDNNNNNNNNNKASTLVQRNE